MDNGIFGVSANSGRLQLLLRPSDGLYYYESVVAHESYPVTRTTNTWYHVAVTYDETNLQTFWNGKLLATTSVNLTLNGDFFIGAGVNGNYPFPWLHKTFPNFQRRCAMYGRFHRADGSRLRMNVIHHENFYQPRARRTRLGRMR